MLSPRRAACSVLLFVHFCFLLFVSSRETWWLLNKQLTLLPSPNRSEAPPAQRESTGALLFREIVLTYGHLAGIDVGYGFFAPNIPSAYTLAFEVTFPDGSVECVPIQFQPGEGGLRWASLMDFLGRDAADPVGEVLLRLIVHSLRQEYPEATRMRALINSSSQPSIEDFRKGKTASERFVCQYDFHLQPTSR